MSTGRAERRPRRHRSAVALAGSVAAAVALLSSCSGVETPSESPRSEAPPEVSAEVGRILSERARAVRSGDLPGFLDSVDSSRGRLVARQERYFLNLRDLPLAEFGYGVEGVVPIAGGGGDVKAVVQVTMQLKGYDAAPVRRYAAYTFHEDPDVGWVMVADRDREFEAENDLEPQPWEVTRIHTVEGDGVLGIFDRETADEAYQIIPAVEEGIREVSRSMPVDWSRSVVVYALSDVSFLAGLDDLPGGDPDRLDGVAFPVTVSPGSAELASTRFMLHPRMVGRDTATRNRLIRHELTHVALGPFDDTVPTWLAEGIAEYVSVRPVPPHDRLISGEALQVARGGLSALPADEDFNGPHSGANYGIAWYAVEYLASAYGEEAVWRLLQAMRADGGTTDDEQDEVLEEVVGIDSAELAQKAARKIVHTFSG